MEKSVLIIIVLVIAAAAGYFLLAPKTKVKPKVTTAKPIVTTTTPEVTETTETTQTTQTTPGSGATTSTTPGSSQTITCDEAKKKYLDKNPDVKTAGLDAWYHYNRFGRSESLTNPNRIWEGPPDCSEAAASSVAAPFVPTYLDGIYTIKGSRENKFCTADAPIGMWPRCVRDSVNDFEKFEIKRVENDDYTIKSISGGRLAGTGESFGRVLDFNPLFGISANFRIKPNGDKYTIQAMAFGNWNYGSDAGDTIKFNKTSIGDWERFDIKRV